MFNKAKVTEKLFGLVGLQNPIDPEYAIVDTDNQLSRSGRMATENPYCKIKYLKETQDDYDTTPEQFNDYLKGLQNKAITDVVDKVLVEPSYIDRQLLYQYPNNKLAGETLPAGFVGYRIQKSIDKNVAFEITRCFLEFFGTGEITLMLFSTASKTPIFEEDITITDSNQVVDLNWRIDNTNGYFQGDFYLGYFTDGLTVTPIKRDYQLSNVRSVITHLHFTPMAATNAVNGELFDLDDVQNTSECYGLNPDVTVFNDYTDLIIQNEMLFAPAIQLQFIINCIQVYIASSRSNRTERLSQEQLSMIIAQLEGVQGQMTGLIPTLRKELTSLDSQLKRIVKGYFSQGFEMNYRS
jgi:hypothetical protein